MSITSIRYLLYGIDVYDFQESDTKPAAIGKFYGRLMLRSTKLENALTEL
jgi:hypothetical protein